MLKTLKLRNKFEKTKIKTYATKFNNKSLSKSFFLLPELIQLQLLLMVDLLKIKIKIIYLSQT